MPNKKRETMRIDGF